MTATMRRVQSTPIGPYIGLMERMTHKDKLAVMAFLVDTMQEERPAQPLPADEEFVREFLATPYDNPMTADEAKQMLRESHHFADRHINPLHDGE